MATHRMNVKVIILFMVNMEDDVLTLESLKLEVRQTFAKVYSALRARELQTIRQIDAIWKQCGNDSLLSVNRSCLHNINISYGNENELFSEIRKFGLIDFAKLNIDTKIFAMEDYIDPQNDHMYSYKCLEDICNEQDSDDSLEVMIKHDAMKQITQTNQCVCYVNIPANEIENKFTDSKIEYSSEDHTEDSSSDSSPDSSSPGKEQAFPGGNLCENVDHVFMCDGRKISCEVIKQLNPTQEWLNQIIGQTETEPSQVIDLMEHTTIECS